MTNKAVRYGIVGIAVVVLVVVTLAGAASAAVYEIRTIDDWTTNVTGSHDCILMNDIDFMGDSAYVGSFSGKLDGDGYSIYNISISGKGLFGSITGAVIKNLIVSNSSIVASTSDYVGGFASGCSGGTFVNCVVKDSFVHGFSYVGGFFGSVGGSVTCETCSLINCTVRGKDSTGGIVGYCIGSLDCDYCRVMNCRFYVSSNTAGGIVALVSPSATELELDNSIVENCLLDGGSGDCGGIMGGNSYTSEKSRKVDNCSVRNCVISSSSGSGGIIGECLEDGTPTDYPSVSNCTVEFCTIVGYGSAPAGGVAGSFPTAGTLDRNKVISSCIVSKSGLAAGICPKAC